MKTPVEIFDEWLALCKLGPRFNPIPPEINEPFAAQLSTIKNKLAQIRQYFSPGRDIEIYADFIDGGTCDAVAGICNNLGLIGLNKGAIMLPLEMFYRMLSHPEVMKGIGNSKDERIGPQHGEGMPTDYDDLIASRKKTKRSLLPKEPVDPVRQDTAKLCIELIWNFVANHEIVHIVHGHVDYLGSKYSVPCIQESLRAVTSRQLSNNELDRQSIEWWADSKAFSIGLRGFLKEKDSRLQIICPRPEQKIAFWSFALFTLFRIWGLEIDPADLSGEHPPTALRFYSAILYAKLETEPLFPEINGEFIKAVHAGQIEAEKAIAYCGAPRLSPKDIIGIKDPRVQQYHDKLMNHLNTTVLAELQKHSYVNLAGQSP